jgi:hypothetical protein
LAIPFIDFSDLLSGGGPNTTATPQPVFHSLWLYNPLLCSRPKPNRYTVAGVSFTLTLTPDAIVQEIATFSFPSIGAVSDSLHPQNPYLNYFSLLSTLLLLQ